MKKILLALAGIVLLLAAGVWFMTNSTTAMLAVLVVALAFFLPMFGITLLLALSLDQLIIRRTPRLRTWFNPTD